MLRLATFELNRIDDCVSNSGIELAQHTHTHTCLEHVQLDYVIGEHIICCFVDIFINNKKTIIILWARDILHCSTMYNESLKSYFQHNSGKISVIVSNVIIVFFFFFISCSVAVVHLGHHPVLLEHLLLL